MTDTKVNYAGSLWHRDCDPFASIIATDYDTAERLLNDAAREEYTNMVASQDCCPECGADFDGAGRCSADPEHDPDPENDICSSGVLSGNNFVWSDEEQADLDRDGYVWVT